MSDKSYTHIHGQEALNFIISVLNKHDIDRLALFGNKYLYNSN